MQAVGPRVTRPVTAQSGFRVCALCCPQVSLSEPWSLPGKRLWYGCVVLRVTEPETPKQECSSNGCRERNEKRMLSGGT